MTKIPATEIQALEHVQQGRPAGACLAYGGGWFWETDEASWRASDAEAADALLERVLVLESKMMDMQHRAQLGDALQNALQAQELVNAINASEVTVVDSIVGTVVM